MKKDWKSLPPALQHQMIIQIGLALFCLVLAIGALAFVSFTVSIPFLLGAALLVICAMRLFCTGMRGQYLILRGVILKVDRTALRQRPKSILLETNGKALQVMLRNRHAAVREGDTVTLYIADTTPLYEWQGIHRLHAYMAMVPGRQDRTFGIGTAHLVLMNTLIALCAPWIGKCRPISKSSTMVLLGRPPTNLLILFYSADRYFQ